MTKRQLAVASGNYFLPIATANRRASGDGNGYDVRVKPATGNDHEWNILFWDWGLIFTMLQMRLYSEDL